MDQFVLDFSLFKGCSLETVFYSDVKVLTLWEYRFSILDVSLTSPLIINLLEELSLNYFLMCAPKHARTFVVFVQVKRGLGNQLRSHYIIKVVSFTELSKVQGGDFSEGNGQGGVSI